MEESLRCTTAMQHTAHGQNSALLQWPQTRGSVLSLPDLCVRLVFARPLFARRVV